MKVGSAEDRYSPPGSLIVISLPINLSWHKMAPAGGCPEVGSGGVRGSRSGGGRSRRRGCKVRRHFTYHPMEVVQNRAQHITAEQSRADSSIRRVLLSEPRLTGTASAPTRLLCCPQLLIHRLYNRTGANANYIGAKPTNNTL